MELEVLEGSKRMILKYKPIVIVEMLAKNKDKNNKIFQFMKQCNYKQTQRKL